MSIVADLLSKFVCIQQMTGCEPLTLGHNCFDTGTLQYESPDQIGVFTHNILQGAGIKICFCHHSS